MDVQLVAGVHNADVVHTGQGIGSGPLLVPHGVVLFGVVEPKALKGGQLHLEEGQFLAPQFPPALDQGLHALVVKIVPAAGVVVLALIPDGAPYTVGGHFAENVLIQPCGTDGRPGTHHKGGVVHGGHPHGRLAHHFLKANAHHKALQALLVCLGRLRLRLVGNGVILGQVQSGAALFVPVQHGFQGGVLLQVLHGSPGGGGGAAPVDADKAHRHAQGFPELPAHVCGGAAEKALVFRGVPHPPEAVVGIGVHFQAAGEVCLGIAEEPEPRVFRGFQHLRGLLVVLQQELHVGLAAGQPHFAHRHVVEGDALPSQLGGDGHFCLFGGLHGRQGDFPFPLGGVGNSGIPAQGDRDFVPPDAASPNGKRLSPLEHHIFSKNQCRL